ncbi:MAG: hypothetical protein ACR2K9_04955 [Solirubrobacteraceae bacterium]
MRKTTTMLPILASALTLGACGGQTVKGSAMSTYAEGQIGTQIQGAKANCPDTDYKQGATVDCPVDVQGKKFVASLKIQGKQGDKVLLSFLKFEPAK